MSFLPTSDMPLGLDAQRRNDPEPGRCIFCDQRCDRTATYHAYCLELHEGNAATAAAVVIAEGNTSTVCQAGEPFSRGPSPRNPAASCRGIQDREEVAAGSHRNEEMPHGMGVAQPGIKHEEHDADGVGDSAG